MIANSYSPYNLLVIKGNKMKRIKNISTMNQEARALISAETEEMEVNLIPNDEVPKDQLEKDANALVGKLTSLGVNDIKTIYQNPSDNFDHGAMNIKGMIDSSKEDSIRDDAIAFLESDLPDYFGSFEYSDDSEASMEFDSSTKKLSTQSIRAELNRI